MQKIKDLLNKANSVQGATLILVVTLFLSNVLGVFRDHFLAQKIPIGILDTYYTAFRIPDLIFNLLILGAISAAFIPVFTDYLEKDKKHAWRIVNSFLNIALLTIIIFSIILLIFMPQLIHILVGNFTAEKQIITVKIARILLLSPIFFSLSFILGGVLNSFKRFTVYSLSPLVYNLSIIISTLLFADKYGVYGVVYGVVVGAFLHFIIQLPVAIKLGFKYQLVFDWFDKGVQKIFILMIPRAIGIGAMQVMLLVYTFIASTISVGSIAIFNLADNIQTMPMVVFGSSIATAIFPTLSKFISQNKIEEFDDYLLKGIRSILYILIPTSLGIILLRTEIVRLILGSGYFGWQQTIDTSNVLGIFTISLFAQGLIPLISRAFYALKNTKTPMFVSLISISISIIFGLWLSKVYGIIGLASSFTIGSIINFGALYLLLRKDVVSLRTKEKELINFSFKILFSAIVMSVFVQFSKIVFGSIVNMHTFMGVLIKLLFSIGIGGGVYLYVTSLLNCEEIEYIKGILANKLKLKMLIDDKDQG
jgi:putative peptidoglycan lipid II flippase